MKRLDAMVAAADAALGRARRSLRGARRDLDDAARGMGIEVDELDVLAATEERPRAALVVAKSANRKLAPVDLLDVGGERRRPVPRGPFVDATYVPVRQTCPTTCAFRGNGCMAQSGYTGRAVRRLEALAAGMHADDVARAESREIDRLHALGVPRDGGRDGTRPRDLRLHVSGDVATSHGASEIARAVARWAARGGGVAWTFTHWWRELPREAWGSVSVLASIEEPADAELARARGYAPALTMREHPSDRAFVHGTTTWIPCPAETRGRTCVECRLCLDHVDRLRESGRGIAFAVHGPGTERVRRQLPVLGGAS